VLKRHLIKQILKFVAILKLTFMELFPKMLYSLKIMSLSNFIEVYIK